VKIWPGAPYPLGATYDGAGTNFSVFSEPAARVELCLFDESGAQSCVDLPEMSGYIWHGYLPNVGPGQRYGYRVHGPWDPGAGLRCNPSKLLLDPYGKAVDGEVTWNEAVFPYHFNDENSKNDVDSAPFVPKSVVINPYFDWGHDRPPRTPWHETVIYETHVKGISQRHPQVPEGQRGTYAGLSSSAIVRHLKTLGVTAIELLPVHQFIHDKHLVDRGLRNYWGYNSIGYLAAHNEYSSGGQLGQQVQEFKQMVKTPIPVWKNYLQVHLVHSFAPYLDSATYNNYFEYVQALSGASKQRPRWKIVLDAEQDAMGEALGQLFVKEYFNEQTKKRYADLVEAIRSAYKDRINKLTWMSAETKKKAVEKLEKITPKVGYPNKWKDFSSLKIDRGPYVLNVERANQWWHNYYINKLGKPVDRSEWGMWPQTYNAYYNPSNNEIVLPAGIFSVPGMRDEELDDAFVYGYAAASTIGHEITHGFDDQGRQYDEKGNLMNWWTQQDSAEFVKRARLIIKQYNEFNPVDTLHINGDATQGENIADLGGVLLGLDAFKQTETYKSGKKVGGFTPLQRYFLGYAYSWLYEYREKLLANRVMTDVHSPAKERVNGPLANIPDFYEAFNVKPGDKMYRADSLRVNIW